MKKIQALNFVIENARYMEDAPSNASYHVRFPTPYSGKVFFSGDTGELVDMVYKFANLTPEGRKLAKKIKKNDYLVAKVVDYDEEEENEGEYL